MEIKPQFFVSAENKEAGHYFTPPQLSLHRELYGADSAPGYTIPVFSEASIRALQKRIEQLELALGGVLYDFDDGVNGGCDERRHSLDYARQVCQAVKFKRKRAKALGVNQ